MDRYTCPVCGNEIKKEPSCDYENACKAPLWPSQLKVPLVSLILSTFFPGLGQVYNGDSLIKGLVFFFGCIFGSFLFLIPGLLIWFYGMYDAYSVAEKINQRKKEYKETKNRDIILIILIPLVVMVTLMIISLYVAIQMLGNLNSIIPDCRYLIDPDNFGIDYYKNNFP